MLWEMMRATDLTDLTDHPTNSFKYKSEPTIDR
jgi:hypothetical protein